MCLALCTSVPVPPLHGVHTNKHDRAILCAVLRMVFIIQKSRDGSLRFDPTWFAATTGGLATLEVHLAAICAALPVFWPVLATKWGQIKVTTEVSVTRESGRIQPKSSLNRELELQSTSSRRSPTLEQSHSLQRAESWHPFVGDEATGLGENETVVVAPAAAKRRVRHYLKY